MGRSQETFGKKDKEQKRMKKRKDKALRKEERKANAVDGSLDSMIAYVDENGRLVDTPPDLTKKKKIKAENIEISVPKKEDIEDPIRTGRVEFFNDDKGYGFIKDLDTQEKFFVHINGLLDKIVEGNKVNFELEKGLKGMNAVRVKKI
ncbi:cold-shock protein [Labilibacter marinus]|uniref:cold-shock protein n=1 Tax=Labilibacter marinus TaxID=1477105 RepID=UPI000835B15E|nr:cold shock domain-containing protein [Labilibacter marinus]